ncbi:MAG: hypothetical protein AAF645_10565 [Myxococcota bacterium]
MIRPNRDRFLDGRVGDGSLCYADRHGAPDEARGTLLRTVSIG